MKIFNIVNLLALFFCVVCRKNSASRSKRRRTQTQRTINNCKAAELAFIKDGEELDWDVKVNDHCGKKSVGYMVKGSKRNLMTGLYEKYITSEYGYRYDRVLNNGTTFKLMRKKLKGDMFWTITRGQNIVSYAKSNSKKPPRDGWVVLDNERSEGAKSSVTVKQHDFKPIRKDKMTYIFNSSDSVLSTLPSMDKTGKVAGKSAAWTNNKALARMLHPAVGNGLGRYLRDIYQSGDPVDGISLDGLLQPALLQKSLQFSNVPLSKYTGPESMPYCCEGKYRLNFKEWNGNKWAKALHTMASDETFINFLQEMTGIGELVPMFVSDDQMLWAGSNLIAIEKGGYLLVHNDFNTNNGYHRRLNVLLYLNEDWEWDWGGHLELWSRNRTHCVQQIPPMFNRMSIFTVTDDAFHGHPEPLTTPDSDTRRYAMQVVYYTRVQGKSRNSPRSTPSEVINYSPYHGAIFQPNCQDTRMQKVCEDVDVSDYRLRCQCSYRDT